MWADPGLKRSWFAETDGWTTQEYQLDFREGGAEYLSMRSPEGLQVVSRDLERHLAKPAHRLRL
ncbi:MAG: hypothetical protein AB7S68_02485 [Polyangiaceae bacterium]